MEDCEIIDLYHRRDEAAIRETDTKYGRLCAKIAFGVLGIAEDAEECVNDTWERAWLSMPPERPASLRAWLGRVTRNLAISRYRKDRAARRYQPGTVLLSELEDCIPSDSDPHRELETRELTERIEQWLRARSEEDRAVFLLRYWYNESVKDLAAAWGVTPNSMSQRLCRLRTSLRAAIEKGGYFL